MARDLRLVAHEWIRELVNWLLRLSGDQEIRRTRDQGNRIAGELVS